MTSRFFKRLWRLVPGSAAAFTMLCVSELGALNPVENISYRWLFHLRGSLPWDERIVLITIDDATLAELGQFPLARSVYTQLLEKLSAVDPIAVGFNILFIESSPADVALADAIEEQGRVVVVAGKDERDRPLLPNQLLRHAAIATGHVLTQPRGDGLVRTVQPWMMQRTAFGITMAEVYSFTQAPVQLPPLDESLWINWPSSLVELSQYSLSDILAGRTNLQVFDDKLVLIGMTATGVDSLPTPYDNAVPGHGVLIHAAVLDNVLQQRYLRPLDFSWLRGLLLLSMPAFSYLLVGLRLRWQLLATISAVGGWFGMGLALFYSTYLLPTAMPMLLLGLTGMFSILGQRLRENFALQRLLEDLWQHYREDIPILSESSPDTLIADDLGLETRKLAQLADSLGRAQATQTVIAKTVPVGLVAADNLDQVWFCNPLATRWLGLELGDRLTSALVPDWLDSNLWQYTREAILGGDMVTPIEKQHEMTWFELRFEPLAGRSHPSPILKEARPGFLMLIEDITHRKLVELRLRVLNEGLEDKVQKRAQELEITNITLQQEILERQKIQEELAYQALHDELTGLYNRHYFMTQLNQALQQIQADLDYQFAVLFLDCDRFKLVNDSFGHLIGDELLKAIAKRLKNCISKTDLVARFGGDEFTILLQIYTQESAVYIAQRIRQRLQDPFLIQGRQLYTGCSIGIVIGGKNHSKAEEILRDADTAMYRAKQGGIGYTLFEPEMHIQVRDSLQLETDLREALQKEELSVHYQPIFLIETQEIKGFEALLRWQHPTHGNVSPERFIPIAEETGLIVPIGQWVLQKACTQLRIWQKRKCLPSDMFMSVNLSVQQFNETDLVYRIDEILRDTELDGQYLKLEITESAIMANSDLAIRTFQSLRERDIGLSIDDFGTGYSSLSYLHCFPINLLKVDRSFIQRLEDGQKHLGLVRAVSTLANHFNIAMVAEGIETNEQLKHLQEIGCPLGQGYLFCRPVSPEILESNYFN